MFVESGGKVCARSNCTNRIFLLFSLARCIIVRDARETSNNIELSIPYYERGKKRRTHVASSYRSDERRRAMNRDLSVRIVKEEFKVLI